MIVKIMNKKTIPKAWLTQDNVVYIGRPSILGNPFVIGRDGTRDEVIAKYRTWLYHTAQCETSLGARVRIALDDLIQRSKKNGIVCLTCWCAPHACHGDVISMWLRENTELL